MNIFNKYLSKNLVLKLESIINKGNDYNDRFILIIFIINSILLFILISLNLYLINELIVNLDKYITVYNHLHDNKDSLLLLITLIYKYYKL